jgi:hypothetical protein
MIAPAGGRGGRSSPPPRGPGPKLLTTAANSIAAEPAPATGVKRQAILVSTSLAIGGGKKRVHSVPRGASVKCGLPHDAHRSDASARVDQPSSPDV